MTPGSVYIWFANKEELFRAVLESALGAQIHSNADFTAAQKLLVEAYYASWRDPAAREMLAPRMREHYAMYYRIIASAQEDKSISAEIDTHMLASLMLAIPTGLALIQMAGVPRPDDISWLEIAGRLNRSLHQPL